MILTSAVTGDTVDVRTVEIGGLEDLTTVTSVTVHIKQTLSGNDDPATVTGSVLEPTENAIQFDLGAWLTDEPAVGRWLVEYQLTFGDGTEQTWPPEPDQIQVRSQLA